MNSIRQNTHIFVDLLNQSTHRYLNACLCWPKRQHVVRTETRELITVSMLGLEALVVEIITGLYKKLQPEFKNVRPSTVLFLE